MKYLKRILAVLAVIIIAGLYLATFLCAIYVKQVSSQLFMACIVASVLVPFLMYLIYWLYDMFHAPEDTEKEMQDDTNKKGFAQAAAYNRSRKQNEDTNL